MNTITITGRLVAEPETRSTTSGKTVCNIRVAVNRPWQKEGTETDFFSCTAFGNQGDFITRNFHKGDGIAIFGSMQNNRYEDKDGNKKDKWQIIIDKVEFNGRKTSSAPESIENDDADELPF